MEYYIYHIPVFIIDEPEEGVDIPAFCSDVEDILSAHLLRNVDVVYIGNFKDLRGRNATYAHGAIYMTCKEPTNFDMLENFVHEVAHSLELDYARDIYGDNTLVGEFKGKRNRLYHILTAEGYHINPTLYSFTEYNAQFDDFLANTVGYPALVSLTMGLFVSPYGATSLQEYFANGFEKYLLGNPRAVREISPVLYRKIEEIINDHQT